MSRAEYPDQVNDHHLYRRNIQRRDYIRSVYQCTSCGSTAEHPTDFRTFGCPGGRYRGADPVDKAALRRTRGDDE